MGMEASRAIQPGNQSRDERSATEVRDARQVALPGDQASQTKLAARVKIGKNKEPALDRLLAKRRIVIVYK